MSRATGAFVSAQAGVGDGVGEDPVEHDRHRVGACGRREQRRGRQRSHRPARGRSASVRRAAVRARRRAPAGERVARSVRSGGVRRGIETVARPRRRRTVRASGLEPPTARQRASSSGSMLTSSANTSSSANACLHIAPPVGVGARARHGQLGALGDQHHRRSSSRWSTASSTGSATIVTRTATADSRAPRRRRRRGGRRGRSPRRHGRSPSPGGSAPGPTARRTAPAAAWPGGVRAGCRRRAAGASLVQHLSDASERAPASERPTSACVAGERTTGHRYSISLMRASERQRAERLDLGLRGRERSTDHRSSLPPPPARCHRRCYIEAHQVLQLRRRQFREPRLTLADDDVGERLLVVDQLGDALLDGALAAPSCGR